MRGAQRHGGVDTELAGCVRGGRDYAAFVGPSAYNDGLTTQRRIVEFFDGNEKSVHVYMEDSAGGSVHTGILARDANHRRHLAVQKNLVDSYAPTPAARTSGSTGVVAEPLRLSAIRSKATKTFGTFFRFTAMLSSHLPSAFTRSLSTAICALTRLA